MSKSKLLMARKLQKVQMALMEEEISSTQLNVLLPLIFKKCLQEKMTFWFNFLEDACVLNLRDVEHENTELNIRYAYTSVPLSEQEVDIFKETLLVNTFLITGASVKIGGNVDVASSAKKEGTQKPATEKPIQESNIVPPAAIRVAMELCEKHNEPITKKNLEDKLELGLMTKEKRGQCIAYLRSMEDKL